MTQFQCPYNGNISGIYALIENRPGHKYYGLPRYVGQSVNIRNRWTRGHMADKRDNYKNRIIAAHRAAGAPVIVKTLLACQEADLDYYEQALISLYRPTLCNSSDGGKRADSVNAARLNHKGRANLAQKKLGAMSDEERSKQGKLAFINGTAAMSIESMRQQGKAAVESGQLSSALKTFQENRRKEQENQLLAVGLPADYRPSRQEAKTYKLRFYYGKVCKHHPDAEGKRYFGGSDGCCTYCISKGKK